MGEMTFADGSRYQGDFVDGEISGDGCKVWESGQKYTGGFLLGELHGHGCMRYVDGSQYEGEWQSNARHGSGVLTLADGSRLEGSFEHHRPTGPCEQHRADGSVLTATYGPAGPIGDAFIAYRDGLQYVGGVQGGLRHGTGTLAPQSQAETVDEPASTDSKLDDLSDSVSVSRPGAAGGGDARLADPMAWGRLPEAPLPPFVPAGKATSQPERVPCSIYAGPWEADTPSAAASALAVSPAPWLPPLQPEPVKGGKPAKKGGAKKSPKPVKGGDADDAPPPLDWESGAVSAADLPAPLAPVALRGGGVLPGLQVAFVWAPPGAQAVHETTAAEAAASAAAAEEADAAAGGGKKTPRGGSKKGKKGALEAEAAAAAAVALETALQQGMPHAYCRGGWQPWWRGAKHDHQRQIEVQLQHLTTAPSATPGVDIIPPSQGAPGTGAEAAALEPPSPPPAGGAGAWVPAQHRLLVHPQYAALCRDATRQAPAVISPALDAQYTATLRGLTAEIEARRAQAASAAAEAEAAGKGVKGGKGGSGRSKAADDSAPETAEAEAARALQRGSAERNREAALAVRDVQVQVAAEAANQTTAHDGQESGKNSSNAACGAGAVRETVVETEDSWLLLPACSHGLCLLPAGTLGIAQGACEDETQQAYRIVFRECTQRVPHAEPVPPAELQLTVFPAQPTCDA